MDDIFVLRIRRTRPRDIGLSSYKRHSDRVKTLGKFAILNLLQGIERLVAHAGHDPHVYSGIRRICDLHAKLRDRRTDRAHAKRHDVHRAAGHAAVKFLLEDRLHLERGHPIIGRSGVALGTRTDVRAVLYTRNVRRVRACQKAVRTLFGV